jgi:hypothetical protein
MGNWKGVRHPLNPRGRNAAPDRTMKLYNLQADPGEERNVAAEHPEIVAHLERLMREQHTPSELFPFPALDAAPARASL